MFLFTVSLYTVPQNAVTKYDPISQFDLHGIKVDVYRKWRNEQVAPVKSSTEYLA